MMACYLDQGVEVMVATCTGGERGGIQNPAMEGDAHAARDMAGARRTEMAKAAAALGIQHRWLGFFDSGLPEGEPLPALPAGMLRPAAAGARRGAAGPVGAPVPAAGHHQLRRKRRLSASGPHHGAPGGCGGFPRRRRSAALPRNRPALGAVQAVLRPCLQPAALPCPAFCPGGRRYPVPVRGAASPPGWSPTPRATSHRSDGTPPPRRSTAATTSRSARQALRAHATQVDPEGFFFAVSAQMQRKIWPWEDYSLIESRVETTLPEHDLFAGLR